MTRVLTVDDSRAIRTMVTKQLTELGFDVDEAEDGEQGLARLAEVTYDLVVLDVTMPVMDGPEMLAQMRGKGNKTPVLMLTSESKTSIIAGCMKLGIEDYILKPFKPEELRAKILKCLRMSPAAQAAPNGGGAGGGTGGGVGVAMAAPVGFAAVEGAGRQFIDVLVVDDMENVHKKLRALLPAHVSMNACVSAQSALAMCRERAYRVLLVDVDIPDVDSASLLGQLRAVQPFAACLGLVLRTSNDPIAMARQLGYDGALVKPFDPDGIQDFLLQYFDKQDVLEIEDNLMKALPYTGREDRKERYYKRLGGLVEQSLESLAAACFDEVILDLRAVPVDPKRLPYLIIGLDEQCKKIGLSLYVVGVPELGRIFAGFSETASVPFFDSLEAARAGA